MENGAYPHWIRGQHVIDARGCRAVVEGRKGDQVLICWGTHDRRVVRGWVHARSLQAFEIAAQR